MSTIREIARELNLSHTTVSRVLNTRNEKTISPATRERVWETARTMGYSPNAAARALATGRTNQIALLMLHLYTSFHAQVVNEVEQILRRDGYQVIITTAEWGAGASRPDPIEQPPLQVDGYLAFESGSRIYQSLTAKRSGKTIPIVAMGGRNLDNVPDQAGFDLAAGAEMALDHLLSIGRRRIAYVGESRNDPRRERYLSYQTEAGRPTEIITTPSQQRNDVRAVVAQYLARDTNHPDALFCFNDEVAIGAYRALRDLGLRIPDDVAIVGYDGIQDAEYLDTPITTVALPIADMCRSGWEKLQNRMANPDAPPSRTMLRPTLIVRESTGGVAVAA